MLPAVETDTSALEDLEFRAELPCEAKYHGPLTCGGTAVWTQIAEPCTCDSRVVLVCERKQKWMTREHATWHCPRCGLTGRPSGELRYFPIVEAI